MKGKNENGIVATVILLAILFACRQFWSVYGDVIEAEGKDIITVFSVVVQWLLWLTIPTLVVSAIGLIAWLLLPKIGEWTVSRAEARLASKEADRDIISSYGGSEIIVKHGKSGEMTVYDPIVTLADKMTELSRQIDNLPEAIASMASIVQPTANSKVGRIENNYGSHPLIPDGIQSPVQWPKIVRLFDVLPNRRGDVNNIVLGVSVNQDTGDEGVISVPLEDMVHEASGGETGTGKSTLAYAIAYQLATAPQDVKLILADPAGTTWKTLANSDRLMCPVIETERELKYALSQLLDETNRRTNELFAPYPTVEKLSEYNALANDKLGYIAMMIDEFPEYMEDRDIEILFKRLIRRSRKAGIYLFAAGTSWKATDMDTSIKRQFRTKIHFAASDRQSSNTLLGSNVAEGLKEPGRAYARLPFSTSADLVEMQCVYLDKADMIIDQRPRLEQNGYVWDFSKVTDEPETEPETSEYSPDEIARIVELSNAGDSLTAICTQIHGYKNQKRIEAIKAVLRENNLIG